MLQRQQMNTRTSFADRLVAAVLLCSASTPSLLASDLIVGGGELSVAGGSLAAGRVDIGEPATLAGDGLVLAPTDVRGTIAPGATAGAAGALTFNSSVVFRAGSTLRARALANESVDRLVALGPVSGTAGVEVAASPGAIPLGQLLADGPPGSDYSGFSAATNWMLASRAPGDLLLTDVVGDTDGDALPDWWEWLYFSSRLSAAPGDDPDGDQFPNSAEFAAGTGPTNAASALRVSEVVSLGPAGVRLTWSSEAGRRYSVFSRASLADGSFSNLVSDIPATAPENTYTSPAPASGAQFYRIGVQP